MTAFEVIVGFLKADITEAITWLTADEAMELMGELRRQAHRLDVLLGNPNHQWNRVNG